ncbi:MAG: recombination mediator RecR [Candidatus Saelkia tenebricola]|nr:recombination mediator RecR [Candidatus Saelkia tenebricola]
MKVELLNQLVEEFSKFPGVGRKTAERFAFHILNLESSKIQGLINSIQEVRDKIKHCKICNNLTEYEICNICQDSHRDNTIICIIEEPKDLIAIEKTGCYRGRYFVLLGALSPLDGIGIKDIKVKELLIHLKSHPEIKELIIATDADAEGAATAHYLADVLKPLEMKVTRIGLGLPVGADLEFIDRNTLEEALKGRREI